MVTKKKSIPKKALKQEAAKAGVSQKIYADAFQHLEDEIQSISMGIKQLLHETKFTEEALYLLIQNACPLVNGKRPTLAHVKSVFEGLENLEDFYLKTLEDDLGSPDMLG